MPQQKTIYDRLIDRIKNNPIAVILLIAGTIIITIATVTDSVNKISQFFDIGKSSTVLNINGKWTTDIIQYDVSGNDMDFRYILELSQVGNNISGVLSKQYLARKGDDSWAILGGELKGNLISFYIKDQYYRSHSDSIKGIWQERAEYRIKYSGTISGNKIDFVSQDDRGYMPKRLTFIRE